MVIVVVGGMVYWVMMLWWKKVRWVSRWFCVVKGRFVVFMVSCRFLMRVLKLVLVMFRLVWVFFMLMLL